MKGSHPMQPPPTSLFKGLVKHQVTVSHLNIRRARKNHRRVLRCRKWRLDRKTSSIALSRLSEPQLPRKRVRPGRSLRSSEAFLWFWHFCWGFWAEATITTRITTLAERSLNQLHRQHRCQRQLQHRSRHRRHLICLVRTTRIRIQIRTA